MTISEIRDCLLALAEEKNAARSAVITPGAKPMLGARIPKLRKLARQIAREDYRGFLEECPETYFEWQMLKAFVLGYAKDDIETLLSYADRFVPSIQDWAVNDGFCQTFTIARAYRERVWNWACGYAKKQEEYAQRVVAVLLMSHFLTEEYIHPVLEKMNELTYDGYYTKMGVAWCVATAYAKFPEETYAFLWDNRLSDWTYDKAIQKMTESYRVPEQDKQMLRGMKRKARRKEP